MKEPRGYILLTVLLLLMLAAVTMAAFCRLTIRRSLEAGAAADELQRRWATTSCRDVLLPEAENLLELNESPGAGVGRLHLDFILGSEQIAVDLCDEQAKANVNAFCAFQGKDRAEQSIAALVTAAGGHLKPRLRLTPESNLHTRRSPPIGSTATEEVEDTVDHIAPVFGSWSEVFPGVQSIDLLPQTAGAVTTNLTCWGNGSLNVRRASAASITQICSPDLSPQAINQMISACKRLDDNASIDELFLAAHLKVSEANALSGRLSTVSAVQSMWIQTRDHSAKQCNFLIRDGTNSGDVRTFSFQWQ